MKNLTFILMITFLGFSFANLLFSQQPRAEMNGELYHHSLTANLNSGAYVAKLLYHIAMKNALNIEELNEPLKVEHKELKDKK